MVRLKARHNKIFTTIAVLGLFAGSAFAEPRDYVLPLTDQEITDRLNNAVLFGALLGGEALPADMGSGKLRASEYERQIVEANLNEVALLGVLVSPDVTPKPRGLSYPKYALKQLADWEDLEREFRLDIYARPINGLAVKLNLDCDVTAINPKGARKSIASGKCFNVLHPGGDEFASSALSVRYKHARTSELGDWKIELKVFDTVQNSKMKLMLQYELVSFAAFSAGANDWVVVPDASE